MSLTEKAISGAKWTTTSTFVVIIVQFLQLSILARVLGPTAIGLMGMIMIVLGFAHAFLDMGISNAIIHKQDTTKKELSSLYWFNLFAGILIFVTIITITPLIVTFFQEPQLQSLIYWASLIFLITPFGQQFQALAQKNLKFDTLSKIEMGSIITGSIFTVSCAFFGFGVLSIVWGQLITAVFRTLNLVILGWNKWRPSFHFAKRDLNDYLKFGLYQVGDRTVNFFNSNFDYMIIGKFLGPEALGYYTLAYNIIILPISKLNPIITRVAFPVFAKIQSDTIKLKTGYLKVINLLSLVNFPIFFGIGVTASMFVPLFFGDGWAPTIILIQILAGVGLLRSVSNPIGSLLYAKGRADLGFKWNLFKTISLVPGLILGQYLGNIYGVAIAMLVLQIIFSSLLYVIIIRKLLGNCFKEYFRSIIPSLWISVVMASILILINNTIKIESLGWLIFTVVLGGFIYISLLMIFERKIVTNLKNLFIKRGRDQKFST
ncbi:hypothetical protein N781_08765 [Pontibacillus halophilus JSM 076056 = DSM 19796]|uniref:Uncharacterized protein n=1 Tax=Pontibacillus halophilus JSM 076056 = DSM 19796 TaxID=1385510 RepID=A0A0A5GDB4_9BACI|nr:MOP flippase family protein [Pontibacillus halophilus]KGX89984.1 hypothetical protein N781_08765 [Pontibacillus halophilus JSM 076056 = DSM 19796]